MFSQIDNDLLVEQTSLTLRRLLSNMREYDFIIIDNITLDSKYYLRIDDILNNHPEFLDYLIDDIYLNKRKSLIEIAIEKEDEDDYGC